MRSLIRLLRIKLKVASPENKLHKLDDAKCSCLNSMYGFGSIKDDNVRKVNFILYIDNEIKYKSSKNEFNCTVKVTDDLLSFKDEIVSVLSNKGYTVTDLSSHNYTSQPNTLLIEWFNKF